MRPGSNHQPPYMPGERSTTTLPDRGLKIQENCLKIWWMATFPPILVDGLRKNFFKDVDDSGRTGDGRPHHAISPVGTVKQG